MIAQALRGVIIRVPNHRGFTRWPKDSHAARCLGERGEERFRDELNQTMLGFLARTICPQDVCSHLKSFTFALSWNEAGPDRIRNRNEDAIF